MIILGLNAYRDDSAACILKDGMLIAAVEEERLRRVKHWAGFPSGAIGLCLKIAGLSAVDVDCVALAGGLPCFAGLLSHNFFVRLPPATDARQDLLNVGITAEIITVERRFAHLAGAYLVSPFADAACASFDGADPDSAVTLARGSGNVIEIIGATRFPHSPGVFYSAVTRFLGFDNPGDEYKVMGMAAGGEPVYADVMRKMMRQSANGLVELDTNYFDIGSGRAVTLSCKAAVALGGTSVPGEGLIARHFAIAASAQAVYEEAFFRALKVLHQMTGNGRLCLGGSCAQNSAANGKIYEKTLFRCLYIPPAPHNAGCAVGAAFYLYNCVKGCERKYILKNPYLGPEYTDAEIESALKKYGLKYRNLVNGKMPKIAAVAISEGKIIGVFSGRTEWGPRALGNRSILADPRNAAVKDAINGRIKGREPFRPFAPSVLEEEAGEWFEAPDSSPFMEKVYKIKEEKRNLIPAVTHIDGTGRLQTVNRDINPKFYGIIKEFEKITGIPVVLNTSFNENEPIVLKPEYAIECFLRTKMDMLVLENYFVESQNPFHVVS